MKIQKKNTDVESAAVAKTLAKKISELLKKSKMSQAELAKRAEVSTATISNWLKGEKEPRIYNLMLVASVFDVSLDYLIGFSNIKSANPNNKHISENFGFSDKTIDNVARFKRVSGRFKVNNEEGEFHYHPDYTEAINKLFENEDTLDITANIARFLFYDYEAWLSPVDRSVEQPELINVKDMSDLFLLRVQKGLYSLRELIKNKPEK